MVAFNIVLVPLLLTWYLTLKQSAALVSARVVRVQRSIVQFDLTDSQWETEVVAEN